MAEDGTTARERLQDLVDGWEGEERCELTRVGSDRLVADIAEVLEMLRPADEWSLTIDGTPHRFPPPGETRPHVLSPDCWCQPVVEEVPG